MPEAVAAPIAAPVVPPAAVAPPPADAPVVAPVAPAKPLVADRFAQLSRKEGDLHRKTQAETAKLDAARKALADERAAFDVRLAAVKDLEDAKASKDPRAAMKALGYTYAQITAAELEAETADEPGAKALREVEALRQERATEAENAKKAEDERAKSDAERAKTSAAETDAAWRAEVSDFVTAHPDDYELTILQGRAELVTQAIELHFERTREVDRATGKQTKPGKILSNKEAADLVEQYLVDEAQKILATKRFSAKVAPPAAPVEPKAAEPKSLSNELGPTTAATERKRYRTDDERIAAAISAHDRSARK